MTPIPGNSIVREFEQTIAGHCRSRHVLSVSNATTGIFGVFYALQLSGAEVITTPLTWPGAISGLVALKCKIRFCDVEPDTLTIDPHKLQSLVSRRTKAVLSADFLGYPAKLDRLKDICDRHKIWLIHDGSSSFGSLYQNRYSGHFADATVMSFGSKKLFTTGEGGCIVTNKVKLYERFVHFLSHPERQDIETGVVNPFAFNARINPLAASYGLDTFQEQLEKIRQRQGRIEEWLVSKGLTTPNRMIKPNYFRVMVTPKQRDSLPEAQRAQTADLPFRSLIYQEPAFLEFSRWKGQRCNFAEWVIHNYGTLRI